MNSDLGRRFRYSRSRDEAAVRPAEAGCFLKIRNDAALKHRTTGALGGHTNVETDISGEGTRRSIYRWTSWPLVPLTLAAVVVAAPYLLTHGVPAMGLALYRGFSVVCHQRPERCFWFSGAAVAVCSRCLGIYLGTAVGLLFRSSRSIAFRLIVGAAALNLLDVVTELAGLHGNWLVIRFALGLALGATAALLISSSVTSSPGVSLSSGPPRHRWSHGMGMPVGFVSLEEIHHRDRLDKCSHHCH